MIRLSPHPDAFHRCVHCQCPLEVRGWCIPGMRNVADLQCAQCGRSYYGDLLAGHGLYFPMLLEKVSGQVHDQQGVGWFANWFRDSYAQRQNTPTQITIENIRQLKRPLLLNCLDVLYGHCLLKLLNAQYYIDHTPEYDLVILIPRFLRWVVPEGAAAIWSVDIPLRQGKVWNDGLDAELHRMLGHFKEVYLSKAFSHPHHNDYGIARFTRVAPFPMEEWENRLKRPRVTFIWREDRLWTTPVQSRQLDGRIRSALRRWGGRKKTPAMEQEASVALLAEHLRQQVKNLEFAVAGFGDAGRLPAWIKDMRTRHMDSAQERTWCEQYANSHVVVGVHGSNMLLPSAHAGASIDLMPEDRWGNMLQDILFRTADEREMMFSHRFLPISTGPTELAAIIWSLLVHHGDMLINMHPDFCNHVARHDPDKWSTCRKNHLRQRSW